MQMLKPRYLKMMVETGNGKAVIAGADVAVAYHYIGATGEVDTIGIWRKHTCPQPDAADVYRIAISQVHTPEWRFGNKNVLYSYPFTIAEYKHLIRAVFRHHRPIANA